MMSEDRPTIPTGVAAEKAYLTDGQQRYRVDSRLGSGGFGAVFKCFHEQTGAWVAVKRLQIAGGDASRLMQEATLIGQVESEHVAKPRACFYDQASGLLYLVSDLATEGDLSVYLRERSGPLPPAEAIELALGIATGVAAIHRHRILHRDIKPANIYIYRRDNRIVPRLGDFGLARTEASLSIAEFASPGYSAPEHLAFEGSGVESDLFSLGMVLYEVLTGTRASKAVDLPGYVAWLKELQARGLERPSLRRPALAAFPQLDELIAQLTAWDRALRRQISADDVAGRLQRTLREAGGVPKAEPAAELTPTAATVTRRGITAVRLPALKTAAVAAFIVALIIAARVGVRMGSRSDTAPSATNSKVGSVTEAPAPTPPPQAAMGRGRQTMQSPPAPAPLVEPLSAEPSSVPRAASVPATSAASVAVVPDASTPAPPGLIPIAAAAPDSRQLVAPRDSSDRGGIISMDGRPSVSGAVFAGDWNGYLDDPAGRPSRIEVRLRLRVPVDRAMNGDITVDAGRCTGTWVAAETTGSRAWFDQRLQGTDCLTGVRVRADLVADHLQIQMVTAAGQRLWSGVLARGAVVSSVGDSAGALPPWAFGSFLSGRGCFVHDRSCRITIRNINDVDFAIWPPIEGMVRPDQVARATKHYVCSWETSYQRLNCVLENSRRWVFDVAETEVGIQLISSDRTFRLAFTRDKN